MTDHHEGAKKHENTKITGTKRFRVFVFRRVFVKTRHAAAIAVVGLLALGSCTRAPSAEPARTAPVASSTAGSVPHGDHNPHHGGIVMMKGDDLHYEVVLDAAGRGHHLYFTDAIRDDLPASVASDVSLTIRRPHAPDERVAMRIDDTGESWIGGGEPVAAPSSTTVRVAFTIRGEPYWIDLSFTPAKPD